MTKTAGFALSARTLYLAIGFAGLALAVASIGDMFAPRPYDGIVPVPYSRGGIEVRASVPGGPAESAGIRSGDCVLGIGKRLVNSTSDASAELRKHAIGETVSYLYQRGRCGGEAKAEMHTTPVRLSSERLGGTTYLYAAALGFLFFFVCRLRPASYWWIDLFVQNTGTVSLFLLPAVFLHFFLIFPRPKEFTFARPDEWTGEPPPLWKRRLQDFLSATPQQ